MNDHDGHLSWLHPNSFGFPISLVSTTANPLALAPLELSFFTFRSSSRVSFNPTI